MNSCGWCGNGELEPGFLEDQGGQGYGRWIQGALQRGPLGGARRVGRPRWIVDAQRCVRCGHLELFATQQINSGVT